MTSLIDRRIRERILVVGVAIHPRRSAEVEESLDELERLVDTAGAEVVGRALQRREAPDPATFVGRGKAEELHRLAEVLDVDTVVFDDELSPAQQRNLEKLLGRSAIDRTAVILDIFAQNARTPEGKAQVEMALISYRLPRLRGRGRGLSQQAGGIGTRGPGETKLEEDRRRLLARRARLAEELASLAERRSTQHLARRRSRLVEVAIVGYTNSGKSTLMRALTAADVLVADRLFATLDPRTRRLWLDEGCSVLCTDTVGFVRKLPHSLIEAFRSTLEVTRDADLLVHVVDAASARPEEELEAVKGVLAEVGAAEVPELLVWNKADRAPLAAERLARAHPGSVAISALERQGLDELRARLGALAGVLAERREVPLRTGKQESSLWQEGGRA
jgi:GTP-binding protein HflX